MTQTTGSGNSESAARNAARNNAESDCGAGKVEEERWTCSEIDPGHWHCSLWYHCK